MRAIALAVLLSTGSAFAGEATQPRVDIVGHGIYTVASDGEMHASEYASGRIHNSSQEPVLVKSTTDVPAKLGTEFGFEFQASGGAPGRKLELKLVTEFPAAGLHDPEAKQPVHHEEHLFKATVGLTNYQGYRLDLPWEAVPGKWTFELWYQDKKLASQTFTLATQ